MHRQALSVLIFNNVTNSIKFIESLEKTIQQENKVEETESVEAIKNQCAVEATNIRPAAAISVSGILNFLNYNADETNIIYGLRAGYLF